MRDAIKGPQGPHSDALREAIRKTISGNQWQSEAISGNDQRDYQWRSVALSGNQSDLALVPMVHVVCVK